MMNAPNYLSSQMAKKAAAPKTRHGATAAATASQGPRGTIKSPAQVPVLTVCGWLGAGKTTLLEHLIKTASGMRIGVLVNDMAAVNVDAKSLARVIHMEEEMVEFSNGTTLLSTQPIHPSKRLNCYT